MLQSIKGKDMKIYSYLFLLFFLFSANTALGYTREEVLQRGWLNCGVSRNVPGFSAMDENGAWAGFNIDLCRALATAVLGDSGKVEFVPLEVRGAYTALLSGKVDLLLLHESGGEWDFTRDSALAVHFVAPSFYDEFGVMAANPGTVKTVGERKKDRSCIPVKGRWLAEGLLQQHEVTGERVVFDTEHLAARGFLEGRCQLLLLPRTLFWQYREKGTVLPETFGKMAFGPIVRQGDDNWFNIVRWVLFAMLDAEELGLDSKNAEEKRLGDIVGIRNFFGYEGSGGTSLGLADNWAAQIIMQVGNYGEAFERNLGADSSLKMVRGRNNLWQEGGLHSPPPLR